MRWLLNNYGQFWKRKLRTDVNWSLFLLLLLLIGTQNLHRLGREWLKWLRILRIFIIVKFNPSSLSAVVAVPKQSEINGLPPDAVVRFRRLISPALNFTWFQRGQWRGEQDASAPPPPSSTLVRSPYSLQATKSTTTAILDVSEGQR